MGKRILTVGLIEPERTLETPGEGIQKYRKAYILTHKDPTDQYPNYKIGSWEAMRRHHEPG